MRLKNKKIIAITMGDPAGIGPEVLAKALKHPAIRKRGPFCIIGDKAVLKRYILKLPDNCDLFDLRQLGEDTVKPGQGTAVSAEAALAYLQAAVKLLKRKEVSALVTAPVHKENICKSGLLFEGHTEFLARAFHRKHIEMMFVAGDLRVVLLTRHIPLKHVSKSVTEKNLLATLQRSQQSLRTQFGIPKPRIAVCGLNPHAGEGGHIGEEEIRVIIPALAAARKKNIRVEGPFAADTLFIPHNAQHFDLIIAMYHDQGLTGVKALCLNNLVNFTTGLPFIRTSPAHGTAFDIAGKGLAHPGSMTAALRLADQLTNG